MSSLEYAGLFASAILVCGFGYYVFRSHFSPQFWEILILATLLPITLILVGLLIGEWYQRGSVFPLRSKDILMVAALIPTLLAAIATFIYATNRPEPARADIPVVYAIGCQSNLPPDTLRFENQDASHGYRSMIAILKGFQAASPENEAIIAELANPSSGYLRPEAMSLINDLTMYLIPYWLSHPVVTPDIEQVMYRKESANWLAIPHASIRGANQKLSQIGGDFSKNSFYGSTELPKIAERGIAVPRGATLHGVRDMSTASRLVIKNNYVRITIGADVSVANLGGLGAIDPRAFPQPWLFGDSSYAGNIQREMSSRYQLLQVTVRFDAEFSRLLYGFSGMRHHEQWAHDLFNLLKRKLSWGSLSYNWLSDLEPDRLGKLGTCA